jgi:hypothetical protein
MGNATKGVLMNSFTEIEELRRERSHIRSRVNALEVCWSCERICEAVAWKLEGRRRIWLCNRCAREQRQHALAAITKSLHGGAN